MSVKVLVAIADGVEEIEAVCIIDTLRRAGASVIIASVEDRLQIKASRGVQIVADRLITACADDSYDLIALPGGMPGAERLRDNKVLTALLKRQNAQNRLYAAICASPVVVLQAHNLLEDFDATCHPSFADKLKNARAANRRVVVAGNCITSQGPGTALEFALKLVELLYGPDQAEQVAKPMLASR